MIEFGCSRVALPDLLGVEKFTEVSNLLDFRGVDSLVFVTLASNLEPPVNHSTASFRKEIAFEYTLSCLDWRILKIYSYSTRVVVCRCLQKFYIALSGIALFEGDKTLGASTP